MRMKRGRPRHCDHRGHTDMAKRVWGAGLRKEKSQGSRARACVCVCVCMCVCVLAFRFILLTCSGSSLPLSGLFSSKAVFINRSYRYHKHRSSWLRLWRRLCRCTEKVRMKVRMKAKDGATEMERRQIRGDGEERWRRKRKKETRDEDEKGTREHHMIGSCG